jgi:hypothetical protein
MGIDKYNAECRSIVMRYASEWRATVERMGRWIDFDNDYKTLNTTFMESIWWGFGELYKKGLVYKGTRVMPYSTGCTTPLSNFEAGLAYKDVNDPAGKKVCSSPLSLLIVIGSSHRLVSPGRRSKHQSTRVDNYSLDTALESCIMCSPRLCLYQDT